MENIFGRKDNKGNVMVLFTDGEPVTRLDEDNDDMPLIWPINSDVSAYYEHPDGLIISIEDAQTLKLKDDEGNLIK